jgi:tetratricopeptide (TPR) repeat protein
MVQVSSDVSETQQMRPVLALPRSAVEPRLGEASLRLTQCVGHLATPIFSRRHTEGKAASCSTPSTTCQSPGASTPPSASCNSTPRELRVCRFCLDCEEVPFEEEANTPAGKCRDAFVTPCPCRGSSKHVHLQCLVQFFEAQGRWHHFKCPTCKQSYEGRALRELARVSRDRMVKEHGPRAPQVAHSLCYLAQAHAQLGSVEKTKECLEEGLAISEEHYGQDHIATAATLAELAAAHGKSGDVQKQKGLLERSLQIKERYFGVGHINTAVTLNNLAAAYSEEGNIQQEKELLERSLEIKEKHYGKGHVQTTAALVNLAGVYSELGDVAKGLELLEWSLDIEERHFGEGHVETAITLNNLALALGESGDVQRMQESLVKCLSIKEHHYGYQHPELCLPLANLCLSCIALGDEVAARDCCNRALSVCANQGSSRRFGIVMLRAASMHAALDDLVSSAELGRDAVAMLQEVLGVSASARVLDLEGRRMCRIWSGVGRDDVARHLREICHVPGTATNDEAL